MVANEVKGLAARTARSTGKIARNTAAIRAVTQDAVQAVVEIAERLYSIDAIARAVADAAHQLTEATGEIARNVAEAAAAMGRVSPAILPVDGAARRGGRSAWTSAMAVRACAWRSQCRQARLAPCVCRDCPGA